MHIPDGFLSAQVSIATWVISIGGLQLCVRKTKAVLKERLIPLMGVLSAFIFMAQMINFPVFGATSGHLLGAALAGILLGPYTAALIMFVVLVAQCLFFQDGGLTALGANVLNMSFLAVFSGYATYRAVKSLIKGSGSIIFASSAAAWVSVVVASSGTALELALSGISPLKIVFPAMAGVYAVIGIGEALITSFILGFILKVRPDLIYDSRVWLKQGMSKRQIFLVLVVIIVLGLILLSFASKSPDGFQKVVGRILAT